MVTRGDVTDVDKQGLPGQSAWVWINSSPEPSFPHLNNGHGNTAKRYSSHLQAPWIILELKQRALPCRSFANNGHSSEAMHALGGQRGLGSVFSLQCLSHWHPLEKRYESS